VATIVEAESSLPKKHLIAQGFSNSNAAIADLNPHISVLNFHGTAPDAVRLNYHLNKVIALDETGGSAEKTDGYTSCTCMMERAFSPKWLPVPFSRAVDPGWHGPRRWRFRKGQWAALPDAHGDELPHD